MWERENVLPHGARIKEIGDKIEDAHRLNNNGQVDNAYRQNLERRNSMFYTPFAP